MRNDGSGRVAEYVLVFVIILLSLGFISAFIPQTFQSSSVFDLIINNVVHIGIAVFISLFAVQRYENKRQNMVFLNEILRKVDLICESIKSLLLEINDSNNPSTEIKLEMVTTYAKSIVEYIEVIKQLMYKYNHQLIKSNVIQEMANSAQDYLEYIAKYEKEEDISIDDRIKRYKNVLFDMISIQTYIPKLMQEIQAI